MLNRNFGFKSCLLAVCAVAFLTSTTWAKDAAAKKTSPPMLTEVFAPIMTELGSLNLQKATILSGPTAVKMSRDKTPGQQWHVQLGQSKFKITIAKKIAKQWTIQAAMQAVEKIPFPYRRYLSLSSEGDKEGVAFYKIANGRPDVLVRQAGRCFTEHARASEPDLGKKWEAARKADAISVSKRGDTNLAKDLTEFARLYAYCNDSTMGRGLNRDLKQLSPKRFELWESILRKSKALPLLHLDVEFRPLGGPLKEGKGNSDGAKVEILSGPNPVEWKEYNRGKNKMITVKGKQWNVKLGEAKFKITLEDVEMPRTFKDVVKLVETLPPSYRAGLVATSEKGETGLTIYKGGCAYGIPSRLAMGGHILRATTLAHEAGHVTDQKSREHDKDIMTKYGIARRHDGVRMSAYGNGPIHEDHAELAKLYAISLAHSPEAFAKFRSLTPARCAIWERMMVLTGGMAAKDVPPFTAIDFDAELKKNEASYKATKPRIEKVRKEIKALLAAKEGVAKAK
jgi:hypothetical protein